MTEARFQRLARSTVTADAATVIKDMILDGRLQPGQRLPSERALSEALGLSRPSVREALRSLVAMHILEVRPGSGTFVSSLTMAELLRPVQFAMALSMTGLRDLLEVRTLIEPGAAALAAERASDEELEGIMRSAEEGLLPGRSHEAIVGLDVELHGLIVRAAHNDLLSTMHESMTSLLLESRSMTLSVPGVTERSVADHKVIAEELCARRPAEAAEAMRAHFRNIAEILAANEHDGVPPASR